MLSLRAILRQDNSSVCAFTVYESLLFSYFLLFCFIYLCLEKNHYENKNSLGAKTCDVSVALNNVKLYRHSNQIK